MLLNWSQIFSPKIIFGDELCSALRIVDFLKFPFAFPSFFSSSSSEFLIRVRVTDLPIFLTDRRHMCQLSVYKKDQLYHHCTTYKTLCGIKLYFRALIFFSFLLQEGFQNDASQIALTANLILSPRATANHRAASMNQFEILSN